ncbi:MAG: gspG [Parachlamydiales bacterium]|nr:gspG [Parachlamydiales bacterium]
MKRAFTLLEIMIVILLITIITGAIGYNMKGALDKGKAFRTERAKEQLHDLLLYCYSDTKDTDQILKNVENALTTTGLAKNPKELIKDGWGVPFEIKANQYKNDFIIHSEKLESYNHKHKIGHIDSSSVASEEEED